MNFIKHTYLSKNLLRHLTVSLSIFGLFFFNSCNSPQKNQEIDSKTAVNEDSFDVPKSEIDLEKPLVVSDQPNDIALCKKIDNSIESSEYKKARYGIIVISLKDGRVVCEREGQELFNPASIQKLLTSIVAFDKLGSEFRWETSVYAKSEINDGTIDGDLILYGKGSPSFDDEEMSKLVKQLEQKGLTKITGNIIGDESYFKGDNLGDGWSWNSSQWYYGAENSALSFNQNFARVTLENGKAKSDSKYLELSGEIQPIEDIEAIGLKREFGTNKVFVWGNGKKLNVKVAVSKPALLTAKIFKEVLEKNGISIEGNATTANWRTDNKLDTTKAIELATVRSQPLAKILHKMNKDSVNFYAEMILRRLGKTFGNEAPDENPQIQKLRGDDLAGTAVIKKWLNENNVATSEIAIHDGSGLTRLNYVTPESIGRALLYASNSNFAETFKTSLPISGQSGTLKGRLKGVSSKILGKTGSISYVNSLAGYAKSSNDTLAFVIIENNAIRSKNTSKTIDEIASCLVDN